MSTPDRLSSAGHIVLKSETFDNNSRTGSTTTRIYTGSRNLVLSQRSVEGLNGASILKMESMGDGNYQLTAQYTWDLSSGNGNTDLPVNQHELDVTQEQVAVWVNPVVIANFITQFGAGADTAMGYIKMAVKAYEEAGDNTIGAHTAAETQILTDYATATTAQKNLLLNIFRGMCYAGVTNSMQFLTLYRRRIMAASYNQIQASFVGVGLIWTTAEIQSFENVPSNWWFQLPSTYQWLKSGPQVLTVANGKTEISYSYQACVVAWAMLYQPYGSAVLKNFA